MLVLTSIGDVLQLPHSMMNAPGTTHAAVLLAVAVIASAASDAESHC